MAFKKDAVLRRLVPLLALLALLALALTLAHVYNQKQSASTLGGTGATLVIDPGHGGIDSGAVGIDGTRESDLNLAIALKLRAMAELYGMENTLLRQDDSTLCDSEDYSEHRDLEHRTELTCDLRGGRGKSEARLHYARKPAEHPLSKVQARGGACYKAALYPLPSDVPGGAGGVRVRVQHDRP